MCGDCGTSFRRRTKRGKVAWKCDIRIEKRKEMCVDSPKLNGERVQKILCKMVCENGIYYEEIVRNNVVNILVFNEYSEIYYRMKIR